MYVSIMINLDKAAILVGLVTWYRINIISITEILFTQVKKADDIFTENKYMLLIYFILLCAIGFLI